MDEIEEIKERYPVGILLIRCPKRMVSVSHCGKGGDANATNV